MPRHARYSRSISLPIILASVTVALSIALLVGWTLIIIKNRELTEQAAQNYWLLIGGIVSFVFIGAVLVWMVVFLVSEILEVRRQNSFIDSVTHELKSPLASIMLCLETIRQRQLSDEQRAELLQMMADDVDRLSVFVDDVLVASQLAYGKATYQLREIVIAEVVERSVKRVARRYKLEDGAVEITITEGLRIFSDPTALETVLNNLVDNAVKYSNRPVQVQVRASCDGSGNVSIEVHDSGIGIGASDVKRVFERFYRAPGEAVHSRRGTGLGLFVVASLIRNLGGKVRAYSDGANKGTRVQILLPSEEALSEVTNG